MEHKGYNASQISSQYELNQKFNECIKILKDYSEDFEEFYNEVLSNETTLLREFNELINGLISVYGEDFGEFYDDNILPQMNLIEKINKLHNWLVNYFIEGE